MAVSVQHGLALSLPRRAATGAYLASTAGSFREHAVDHGPDGAHLLAVLAVVAISAIAPPIPTALRVAADLGRIDQRRSQPLSSLRVEHNHVVGLGPRVIPGISEKNVMDFVHVLLTTVKGDVQAAFYRRCRTIFASCRNVEVASL